MNENTKATIEGLAAAIVIGLGYLAAFIVAIATMALPVLAVLKLLGLL